MTSISLDSLPAKTGTVSDAGIFHYRESGVDKKLTVSDLLTKILSSYDNLDDLETLSSVANLTALAGLTGALNKLPYFNGLGSMTLRDLFSTSTTQGINYLSLPINPITIANNSGTPNTDIDFTAGTMTFHDGSGQALSTAMTKRLQSTGAWSAGNNGNLLLSGARANNSTYHLFALYKTDGTVDYNALLGVAGTDPNPTGALPTDYTKYDYRGSILTDGSGNIRPFIQLGKQFIYDNYVNDHAVNPSASVFTTYAFSIPKINGIIAKLYGNVSYTGSTITGLSFTWRRTGTTASNPLAYTATNGFDALSFSDYLPMNNLGQVDISLAYSSPISSMSLYVAGYINNQIKI
jgi:hypothetical protein